jgi:hypothetical protein
MTTQYDSWKLASPPEADEEDLKDITCSKCGWEGNTTCTIYGHELTWQCPACEHDHSEDPKDRFGPDPDDRY